MDTSNRPQSRAKGKPPTHRPRYSKGLNRQFEQRLRGLDNVVDFSQGNPDVTLARQLLTKFHHGGNND